MLRPLNYQQIKARNIEHHIERHYEIEADETSYLQRIAVDFEFYEDRLEHCLHIPEMHEVDLLLLDEYGDEDVLEEFEYLHYSTFISFFRSNSIDIPRCFRKTLSVRRAINEVDILKFNNYLMRHGLRARSWSFLSEMIVNLSREYFKTAIVPKYGIVT